MPEFPAKCVPILIFNVRIYMRAEIISRLKNSRLFKDSFWAVYGNGLGYGMLLLSGIIIARLLGKDDYGEYGLVKTTMFLMASFTAFGLNITSTKYIAEAIRENITLVRSYARDALTITTTSSIVAAIVLCIFAAPLSKFLNEPALESAFQVLGVLIIIRSLIYTLSAILSGFGAFKVLAKNNVICGIIMLVSCYPLTYYYGITGAFISLTLSQLYNAAALYISYLHLCKTLPPQTRISAKKKMIFFSFPVALQEISQIITQWGGILLITKLSTLGELGIYSAASQWNAIILFIPNMLINVVISHLSSANTVETHHNIMKRALLLNIACSAIPFFFICILSDWISSFYGESFTGMSSVLKVLLLSPIFACCSKVLYAELISRGKTWHLFIARCSIDLFMLVFAYVLISNRSNSQAALLYSVSAVSAAVLYFIVLLVFIVWQVKVHKNKIYGESTC